MLGGPQLLHHQVIHISGIIKFQLFILEIMQFHLSEQHGKGQLLSEIQLLLIWVFLTQVQVLVVVHLGKKLTQSLNIGKILMEQKNLAIVLIW